MGEKTGIQWTSHTWNPWQGCQKVSPGCDNCYMYREKRRYGQDPTVVVLSKKKTFRLNPLQWNREAKEAGRIDRVFVASWADFFSKEADAWRPEAWEIIKACDHLIFQILTKRHARIADHLPPDWGDGYPNVWLGVSAENAEWWNRRVPLLLQVPARVRFVSYEPALGSIAGCSAKGIDWVIGGGESGSKGEIYEPGEEPASVEEGVARQCDIAWLIEMVEICRRDGAAPFIKQFGSNPVMRMGPAGSMCPMHRECSCLPPLLSLREPRVFGNGSIIHIKDSHGGEMDEWPEKIRIREYPP